MLFEWVSTFNKAVILFDATETVKNIIKAWVINIIPKIKNWKLIEIVSEKRKFGK